jgi:hypothetical protein
MPDGFSGPALNQAHGRMTVAGQNDLVTCLGTTHQFGQLPLSVCDGYLHRASSMDHPLVHICNENRPFDGPLQQPKAERDCDYPWARLPVPYTRDWRPLFEGELAGKRTPTASSPGEPTT